jgi:ribosomal protein S18 acetylase RimI-like enzyme
VLGRSNTPRLLCEPKNAERKPSPPTPQRPPPQPPTPHPKKLFIYELHVRSKRRGLGRALLELAEGAGVNAKRRTPPMVELNVHLENDAQAFYTHLGFAESGRTRDGLAIVMRRQRA